MAKVARRQFLSQPFDDHRPNGQGPGSAASLVPGIPKGPGTRPPLALGVQGAGRSPLESESARHGPNEREFEGQKPLENAPARTGNNY